MKPMKLGVLVFGLFILFGCVSSAYAISIDLSPEKFEFKLNGDVFNPKEDTGDKLEFTAKDEYPGLGAEWTIEIFYKEGKTKKGVTSPGELKEDYTIENDSGFKTEGSFDSYAVSDLGGDGYLFRGVFVDDLLGDLLGYEGDTAEWYMDVYFLAEDEGTWKSGTVFSVDSSAPVPEPSTLFLVGIGLLGLGGVRRKMTRK